MTVTWHASRAPQPVEPRTAEPSTVEQVLAAGLRAHAVNTQFAALIARLRTP